MNEKLKTISNLFEEKEIRSIWDSEKEDYYCWYYKSFNCRKRPRKYWNYLKIKLTQEESQLSTKCVQLKMKSQKDGKSI